MYNMIQQLKNNRYTLLFVYLACTLMFFACGSDSSSSTALEESEADSGAVSIAETRALSLPISSSSTRVLTGAEQLIANQLDLLKNKRVAIIANPTSCMPDGTHLVDTLIALGVNVVKVFGPEHGFRGDASAGTKVKSSHDKKTGLPVLSLYGNNRKPKPAQLKEVDVVIFDIQDVGSRHYTYIYTMSYAIEACAENNKPIIILDRPNPNGWYVDGPVLNKKYSSFIGMHEIPIVHGMTVGEYAQMVNEEGWLKNGVKAELTVISCANYTHQMRWEETGLAWIPPSPNLATEYAAYLYPAICWLEPTVVSVGRGTDEAFTIIGAPWFSGFQVARTTSEGLQLYGLQMEGYTFTPRSLPGKSEHPKFQDESCQGLRFKNRVEGKPLFLVSLSLLQSLYQQGSVKGAFFKKGFEKWAGNAELRQQVINSITPEDIYASWQPGVEAFKEKRKKYLLYEE